MAKTWRARGAVERDVPNIIVNSEIQLDQILDGLWGIMTEGTRRWGVLRALVLEIYVIYRGFNQAEESEVRETMKW